MGNLEKLSEDELAVLQNSLGSLLGGVSSHSTNHDKNSDDESQSSLDGDNIIKIMLPIDYILSDFLYSNDIRMLSTFLLLPQHNREYNFAVRERARLKKIYSKVFKRDLDGVPLSSIDIVNQPRQFVNWININERLLSFLSNKRSD